MISFLLAFLAVYSSMHVLVALRVWPLLPRAWYLRCAVWCFGLVIIVAPIVTYWLDHSTMTLNCVVWVHTALAYNDSDAFRRDFD
jgi:Na+/melibiose symporter-like transporter